MRNVVLLLIFFSSLVYASPYDFFTRHTDLSSIGTVQIEGVNYFVNQFGEKEVFLDSISSVGSINIAPRFGDNLLIRDASIFKLDASQNEVSVSGGISNALDGKPSVETDIFSNTLIIRYNPLSRECGGNYGLFFTVASPHDLNVEKRVALRFHVRCEADLLLLVSEPVSISRLFLDNLRYYIDTAAREGKTVKVALVSFDALSVPKSPSSLDLSRQVVIETGTKPTNVFSSLSASLQNNIDEQDGVVVSNSFLALINASGVQFSKSYFKNGIAVGSKTDGTNKYSFSATALQSNYFENLNWIKVEVSSKAIPTPQYFIFIPRLCNNWSFAPNIAFPELNEYSRIRFVKPLSGNCDVFVYPFHLSTSAGSSTIRVSTSDTSRELLGVGNSFKYDVSEVKIVANGVVKIVPSASLQITSSLHDSSSLKTALTEVRSKKFKKVIEKLRAKYSPNYLLIIGSFDDLPMYLMRDEAQTASSDGFIPSDSLYALSLDAGKVEIPVARIPVPTEGDQGQFAANVLASAIAARVDLTKSVGVISDACGGKNCLFKTALDKATATFLGKTCAPPNCFLTPPNCKSPLDPKCKGVTELLNSFDKFQMILVNSHGSGRAFYARSADGKSLQIIDADDLELAVKARPIVSVLACYGGTLDQDSNNEAISGTDATAFGLLQMGAPLVFANTRTSFLDYKGLVFDYDFFMLNAYKNHDRRAAGDVFLDATNKAYKLANKYSKINAISRQIYGDPLLPFYRGN